MKLVTRQLLHIRRASLDRLSSRISTAPPIVPSLPHQHHSFNSSPKAQTSCWPSTHSLPSLSLARPSSSAQLLSRSWRFATRPASRQVQRLTSLPSTHPTRRLLMRELRLRRMESDSQSLNTLLSSQRTSHGRRSLCRSEFSGSV